MCFCQKSKMRYPRICLFTTQLIVGNNVRQQTSFNKSEARNQVHTGAACACSSWPSEVMEATWCSKLLATATPNGMASAR